VRSSFDELGVAYAARLDLLREVRRKLETELLRQLDGVPHVDRVSFRVKDTDSFVRKITERIGDAQYAVPLLEVEDQIAGRVIVLFTSDVEVVKERTIALFNPVEAIDRGPAKDAEFGYQSFHAVFGIPDWAVPEEWPQRDDLPTMFELQIRTLFQHAYAEPQHNLGYKPSAPLTSDEKRELAWIAASAWGADRALVRVRERLGERSRCRRAETSPPGTTAPVLDDPFREDCRVRARSPAG
jgi:putative GTP pyrophosphokinase